MKLNELTKEAFIKVVSDNNELTYRCHSLAIDTGNDRVYEILSYLPDGAKYSIGYCDRDNHVKLFNCFKWYPEETVEALLHLESDFCSLSYYSGIEESDFEKVVRKLAKYLEVMDMRDADIINVKNSDYSFMEEYFIDNLEKIENAIIKWCENEYEYLVDVSIEDAYDFDYLDDIDYDPDTGVVSETITKVLK